MKILIVDDSKVTRKFVSRCIRQANLGDHTIEEAENGLDALKRLSESTPDIVLSDWNMPHMSGIELLSRLRGDGNPVKLGFITSEGTDEMRQEAEASGAEFFITKPFNADTLRTVLQDLWS